MVDNLVRAEQQLEQLRIAFTKRLPQRVEELADIAAKLDPGRTDESVRIAEELGRLAHRLAGSAGTFGFLEFGEMARALEQLCDQLQNTQTGQSSRHLPVVHDSIKQMEALATSLVSGKADPPAVKNDKVVVGVSDSKCRRVLLIEDDQAVGEQLTAVLPNFGFRVDWLQHPTQLAAALDKGQPDILLMDVMYPDGRDLGVQAVGDLQRQGKFNCPVIFISARDDLDVRLQAARTGCDGYLPKPLDIPDLLETLKHFVRQAEQSSYRVLVVEDDTDLIDWYRVVLGEGGFLMKAVNNPEQLMAMMQEYTPDVILMDIEMPDYNGLELAKVIRQFPEYLQIPIVFVSGAANTANQMDAWRSGGDDFLAKPVQPERLLPSLNARAQKSRALVSLSVHQKVKASRERFNVLSNVLPVATVYTDSQGLCLFVNPKFSSVTGATPDEAFGRHWTSWVKASERANVMKLWSEATQEQAQFESALRFGHQDDRSLVWMIVRASPQIDDVGETIGYAATFTDISELKHTEESLLEAKHLLEKTFASIQDAVFVCNDQTGEILHANEAAETLFGYTPDKLEATSLALLFSDEEEYNRYFTGLGARISKYGVYRTDVRMLGRAGAHLLAEHTITSLDYEFKQGSFVIVIRDVTEPRALTKRLAYEASHDPLTGQYNRFEMDRRVAQTLELVARDDSTSVLCYLDLDRFKLVNDSCGHQAGDRVLREVAALLAASVRQGDILARIGGDEFAVLMERCNLDQAHRVADAILARIADYRLEWDAKRFSIGISIGMVRIDRHSGTISDVIKAADSACYAAKDSGRNRIHVYQQDDARHLRRDDDAYWGMLIERALEENRFELFSQPIVPAQSLAQSGEHFEILLRMHNENGELVSPCEFLPAAEHFHLTTLIDRCVLQMTLDWLAANDDVRERLQICSINISGQSLADDRLLDFALECLAGSNVSPEQICFEITETAAVSDIDKARRFIRSLKEEGCLFALDDFGTGVSNFSFLKDLPVDFLKIDGSFIKDIEDDPLDMAMVSAINEISHVLGKATIAEYVWNEKIAQLLREIGVDYLQGFGVGKPKPVGLRTIKR